MTCEDYRDLLVAFEDNELSASEEALLKNHLKECDTCSNEIDEIRKFARDIHNASATFRESVQRISPPKNIQQHSYKWLSKWAAIAAAFLLIVSVWYLKFERPDVEKLASWGIEHYALVDQTHPVKGNASTVEEWFQTHHQIAVRPPGQVDYSYLSGCKMAEMNSQQVPLLRFDEKPVKAVFILPEKSIFAFQKVLHRDGYQIDFWKEESTLYMSLKRG